MLAPCNFRFAPGYRISGGYPPIPEAVIRRSPMAQPPRSATVKGFGRLRTKASSAGTRGPHALVYG